MEVRLLRNPGNGVFAGSIQLASDLPLIVEALVIVDLDGDGRRDLLLGVGGSTTGRGGINTLLSR